MQMKTFLNSWRSASGVEDQILSESRQSDAYSKYPFLETHIDYMVQNDPSDNNKYLPYFTKVFGKDFKSELERIGRETYERSPGLASRWPRARRSAKIAMINNAKDFIHDIIHFHINSAVYDHKDIFAYKTQEDLAQAKKVAEDELERRDMEKKYAKRVKNEVQTIYSDHNIIVRRPESHAASALFGLGARWCISERDNEGFWNDYENGGNAFYFLELKNNPPRKNVQKFAHQFNNAGQTDIYDEEDDSVDSDTVELALHQHFIRGTKNKKALAVILKHEEDFFDYIDIDAIVQDFGIDVATAYKTIVKDAYGWDDLESMMEWVEQIYHEITSTMEGNIQDNPPGPNWEDLVSEAESKLQETIEHISWYLEYQEEPFNPHVHTSLSYQIGAEFFEDLDWLEEDYDYDDDLSDIVNDYSWPPVMDYIPDDVEIYNGEVTIHWNEFSLSGDIDNQLDEFLDIATTIDENVPQLSEYILEELNDRNLLRNDSTTAIEAKIKLLNSELNNFDVVFDGQAIYAIKTLEFDYDAFYAGVKKRIDTKEFTPFGFGPKNILPSGQEMNQTVARSVTAYYQKLAASLTTADSKQIDIFGKDSPQIDFFGTKDHTKYNPATVSLRVTSHNLHEIFVQLIFRIGEFKKTEEGVQLTPKTSLPLLKFINDNEIETMLGAMFQVLVNASITINLPTQEKESLTESKVINVNKKHNNFRSLHDTWNKFLK